jgi:hypothetical protein
MLNRFLILTFLTSLLKSSEIRRLLLIVFKGKDAEEERN